MFSFKVNKNTDLKADRINVSQLILDVLCEKLTVKDALLKFPNMTNDKSLIAAWHALSHYEADEDLRLNDLVYKEEQDDYLEFIAFCLRDNKDLPLNIINAYSKYYKDIPIADNKTVSGKLHKLMRFLNVD